MLAELLRQGGDIGVEADGVGRGPIRLVGDRCEVTDPIGPEQPALRRGGEAHCERDHRESRSASMLQRETQELEVRASVFLEPIRQRPMNPAAQVLRKLRNGGRSNQVVRGPGPVGRQLDEATLDEVAKRGIDRLGVSAEYFRSHTHRDWTAGEGKGREQCRRVAAGAPQSPRQDLVEPAADRTVARQRLEPEGAALRLAPDGVRCLGVEARVERLCQGPPLVLPQGPELDAAHRALRQRLEQLLAWAAGPCRREEPDALLGLDGGPDQVVAQRQGHVVDPLEVVDDEERRLAAIERAVSGLEDSQRVERSAVGGLAAGSGAASRSASGAAEHQRIQDVAVVATGR